MNLGPNIFFVSNKAGVYDFFKTRSTIPFGWLIKLGTDSFFDTDKAEVIIEIGCCSARCLFLNTINVLVSVFFLTINDDDDDDVDDGDDGKDDFDRFRLKHVI